MRVAYVVVVVMAALACQCRTERTPGPAGGEVRLAEGDGVRLVVPPGALSREVPITLERLRVPPASAIGATVEAGPHGLRFERSVALRFSPSKSALPRGISFGELRVATLTPTGWELLPTAFPAPGVVEGLTTHFSTFGLVAPCHVSGVGRDFPLTHCPTFNPRIEADGDVELEARGAPVSLVLSIWPSAGPSQVQLTISGLRPDWEYFLTRDDAQQQLVLRADAAGRVSFQQDTCALHRLLLMARPAPSLGRGLRGREREGCRARQRVGCPAEASDDGAQAGVGPEDAVEAGEVTATWCFPVSLSAEAESPDLGNAALLAQRPRPRTAGKAEAG